MYWQTCRECPYNYPSPPPPLFQGVILSSFFWGYILLQVVGGALADRYGGDRVHWVSGVVWSLGTLLTVAAIPFSSSAVIAVRFIMGLTQGGVLLI